MKKQNLKNGEKSNTYSLIGDDFRIVIKSLEQRLVYLNSIQEELESNYVKLNTNDDNVYDVISAIGTERFDVQGLIAMFKESEFVNFEIRKTRVDSNWASIHNVDMPIHYFEQCDEEFDQEFEDNQVRVRKNAEDYFKNLIMQFDTYSLSDCVEEVVEGMDEEYAEKWIKERDVLREECKEYGIDFHAISCEVASEYMDGVLHFWQKDFDRWIWVQYKEGMVVGLDFQQGIDGTSDYEFESNHCLTEIYKSLYNKYDVVSKAINESIELYYIAFVNQEEVLTEVSREFDLSKK